MAEMSLMALRGLLPQAYPGANAPLSVGGADPQGFEQWRWLESLQRMPQQLPPAERDNIERVPRPNIGHDRNAVMPDEIMRRHFWPQDFDSGERL